MSFQKHCPGCFHDKSGIALCPVCGYDESAPRSPVFLPHGIIIGGQYRVGRVLGRPGGFGVTYLGWDINLQQRVAIKEFLPRDIATRHGGVLDISVHVDEDRAAFDFGKEQFLREARIVARLDHPNVVRVRNYFNANGTAYLVMDYYDGMSLGDYLAGVRPFIEPSLAVPLIRPVLEGLQYMHEREVVHRDLKPHNIYLASIGKPIILDFGAARQAAGERVQSLSVVLTEGYAPLEQYQRRSSQGPWTDVYGAGATLYRMITGQAPPIALDRLGHDPLEVTGWAGVPDSLRPALAGALAVKPEARFQSAAEFLAALAGFNETYVPGVQATAPERPSPAPLAVAEAPGTEPQPLPPLPEPPPPAAVPMAQRDAPLTPPIEPQTASVQAAAENATALLAPSRGVSRPLNRAVLVVPAVLVGALVLLALVLWPGSRRERSSGTEPETVQPSAPPTTLSGKPLPPTPPARSPAAAAAEPVQQPQMLPVPGRSGLQMAQTEITYGQFAQFQRLTGYENPLWANYPCESAGGRSPHWDNPGYAQDGLHPVVCVNLEDAMAYAAWLSKETGQRFRLPTEAEWDMAARAGTSSRYWWGDQYNASMATCSGCPQMRTAPQPTGSWPKNPYGFYDTAGNVREWTCSAFQGDATRCIVLDDGAVPIAVRGGSWQDPVQALATSNRSRFEAYRRNAWTGFRVVQDGFGG